MATSVEMEQGASQSSAMVRSKCLNEDPVIGSYTVSEELQPVLATSPFKRLRRLKQLGVFMAAEHSRYGHSISVGVLARRLGEHVSQRLLVDEDAAGPDVVVSAGAAACCRKDRNESNMFAPQHCRATKQELLQLELAGFAHDLGRAANTGHGPWSHLWERYMHSVDDSKGWSHEEMSEKLLDAAVQEVVTDCELPCDHFLCNSDNITAVKAMIRGDAHGVPAPKTWLYSIVCNDRSGLDVDKLDYLLRDQHMVFGRCPKGHFNTYSQLQTLFNHARVVAVMDPDTSELVTDIAFENTRNQELIRLVDGIFQTRLLMHELVYRHGDVIATEERMLHLLQRVPQGNCEWIRKSRQPEKFVHLDDTLLEKLAEQHPHLKREIQMLEGPSGGWRAIGSPWIVPEALAPGTRTISVLEQQIEMIILPEVAKEVASGAWKSLRGRLQVRMAAIGDGAKGGSMRAVQKVPFFSGDGPLPSVEWFDAESLMRVYSVGAYTCTPCKRVYCHLQCWHGTEGPNSDVKAAQQPSEHELNVQLCTAFNRVFSQFVKEQLLASCRSSPVTHNGATAAAVSSGEDETPKAHKVGTVFGCKITQNSDQLLHPEWPGARTSLAPAAVALSGLSSVVPVDTPPRKRAREDDSTPMSELVTMGAAPAPGLVPQLPPQKFLKGPAVNGPAGKMETIPDTDDEGEDEENQGGGVLTQPGASLSLQAIYTAD